MSDIDWVFNKEQSHTPEEALLYQAWTVIANAWGGDWSSAPADWREAAERWRDDWHEYIERRKERATPGDDIGGTPVAGSYGSRPWSGAGGYSAQVEPSSDAQLGQL